MSEFTWERFWVILTFVTEGFAWSCDFENGTICDLVQSSDDDFDWTLQQGPTPSSSTGPSADHTRNDGSGYYLFMEASDPRVLTDNAVLVTPELPAGYYSVSLWYHAYGSQIGVFRVSIARSSVSQFHELIFFHSSKSEYYSNNQWIQVNMNISASNSFIIIFEGIRGIGVLGDIGLDDIDVQRITEPMPEEPASPFGLPINCTFETDADCGLESPYYNSQIDWIRNRGPTPSSYTGPDIDHTLGTAEGYYIFAEASFTRPNWTSIIATRSFWPIDGCFTLSFYYHAYGEDVNALQVFEEGVLKPILHISPISSVDWQPVTLNHTLIKPGRLLFVGLAGLDNKADYGLDDIIIEPSECDLVETTQPVRMSTTHELPTTSDRTSSSANNQTTTQEVLTPRETTSNSVNNQMAMVQLYAVLTLCYCSIDLIK